MPHITKSGRALSEVLPTFFAKIPLFRARAASHHVVLEGFKKPFHQPDGSPRVTLPKELQEKLWAVGVDGFQVSISNEGGFAIAVANAIGLQRDA